MYTSCLIHEISSGDILNNFPLPTLNRSTENNASALRLFQKRQDGLSHKSCKVGAQAFKCRNRPGLIRDRHWGHAVGGGGSSFFSRSCIFYRWRFTSVRQCVLVFIVRVERNKLSRCNSGCIKVDKVSRIHHSQVSVVREIYEENVFSEEKEDEVKEDCVFCYRVFGIAGIRSVYIDHPLSKYIASYGMAAYKKGME